MNAVMIVIFNNLYLFQEANMYLNACRVVKPDKKMEVIVCNNAW